MEPNTQEQAQTQTAQQQTPATPTQDTTTNDGVNDHKLWAILGYILPFLFFIPMLDEKSKHNAFARFHAEQQLALLVVCLGVYVAMNVLAGMFFMGLFFLMLLINIAVLVLVVMGVLHAAKGETKELPLIGGIKLLSKVFGS